MLPSVCELGINRVDWLELFHGLVLLWTVLAALVVPLSLASTPLVILGNNLSHFHDVYFCSNELVRDLAGSRD